MGGTASRLMGDPDKALFSVPSNGVETRAQKSRRKRFCVHQLTRSAAWVIQQQWVICVRVCICRSTALDAGFSKLFSPQEDCSLAHLIHHSPWKYCPIIAVYPTWRAANPLGLFLAQTVTFVSSFQLAILSWLSCTSENYKARVVKCVSMLYSMTRKWSMKV